MKTKTRVFSLLIIFLLLTGSCTYRYRSFRTNYKHYNEFVHDNALYKPFLKAHLKNGDVCILSNVWNIDTIRNELSGHGIRYDYNRKKVDDNNLVIPIDSVAIFETNTPLTDTYSKQLSTLTLLASVDAILSVICLTNPKACFGSCPTFYTGVNDDIHYANAEGFSSSVSPSLEATDIDALDTIVSRGNFTITMKNEALETHCVKEVKLLACPVSRGEKVYQSNRDVFYSSDKIYPLKSAFAGEGDITKFLSVNDKQEWVSLTDKHDLCSKEEILLDFGDVDSHEPIGLEVSFRQTFLSTYMFYSIMGYMGNEVGTFYAKIETDKKVRDFVGALHKELGGIDVYVWDERNASWTYQDSFNEKGPIAFNNLIIPLQILTHSVHPKIKLRISKGSWKLDYAALVNLKTEVKPITISANRIMKKGKEDKTAIANLNSAKKYLVSMPGDVYKLSFALPTESMDYELFLSTRGYYLEWMRDHWMKDKNLLKLKWMYDHPRSYLKKEAAQYKIYEGEMNDLFWSSKINTGNQ
jgi:hypothetical protein